MFSDLIDERQEGMERLIREPLHQIVVVQLPLFEGDLFDRPAHLGDHPEDLDEVRLFQGRKVEGLPEGIGLAGKVQDRVADKIRLAAGGDLSGKIVAIWGLTFKAGTDDLRDSPAIAIIERLMKLGARVQAYDPTVNVIRPGIPNDLVIAASCGEATAQADVLAVLTEWDEFKQLDFKRIFKSMPQPAFLFDGRNILDRQALSKIGFEVHAIGKA